MDTTDSPLSLLARMSDSLSPANEIEDLVRPLLELLEAVTGLESTYVTRIDAASGRQTVLYARNAQALDISEGLSVGWNDTLCKRALESGLNYCDDVPGLWADSRAARELGIRTFATTPIHDGGEQLYGTLCAASREHRPMGPGTIQVMLLFSRLIGRQVERERLLEELRQAQAVLETKALTDVLTGLPNRMALMDELRRRMARSARDGSHLLVAFVDLDHFKKVNDEHGHDAGDRLLICIAEALRNSLRGGDYCARLGGDEFIALVSVAGDDPELARGTLASRLEAATCGRFDLGNGLTLDYGGASIGVVVSAPGDEDLDALLARADAAMYEVKHQRKSRDSVTPSPSA
ncbi:sensor domain-containing diguanylate cyclase [Denitratimonas sp. CY0512]|uniref:GGDEF domain-containing protein n=1 Tax=Denitratimonas sp. CY0512 TaxID=3131940 RepID=UPI0030B6C128